MPIAQFVLATNLLAKIIATYASGGPNRHPGGGGGGGGGGGQAITRGACDDVSKSVHMTFPFIVL